MNKEVSNLPAMVVEERISTTAHGLRPPTEKGSPEQKKQLQDMLILCQGAKTAEAWPETVLEVLREYAIQDELGHIPSILQAFGFQSWYHCVQFVKDDECIAFLSLANKFCKRMELQPKKDRGFIDGEGVGLYKRYTDRLTRKSGALQKAFDAKYYFKHERPLVVMNEVNGHDCSSVLNYVHPGHWSYPAGHGAKFFEAVDVLRDTYETKPDDPDVQRVDDMLLTAAYVLAMARSGGGVHFPEDNVASAFLAGIPEGKQFAAVLQPNAKPAPESRKRPIEE